MPGPAGWHSATTPAPAGQRSDLTVLRRLKLTTFRSYGELDTEFSEGPQVVVGANAAGKTNLIESLVVAGTGHSHRASLDSELISWGADFARLEADVEGASTDGSGRGMSRIELVLAPRLAAPAVGRPSPIRDQQVLVPVRHLRDQFAVGMHDEG